MKMSRNAVLSWEKNRGHLDNCRSILQEIVWMVENWDSALQSYHVTRREEEVTHCENALLKVKEVIWTSCLSMFSKYDPQTKKRRGSQNALMCNQPEMTGTKVLNNSTEVLTNEINNIPAAIHQHEATHTVVLSNSPHQQIVKNLLLEWSVFINANFQLCMLGTLPNDGTWETSAISARLGPNTVKTISGTVYNMHGKMVTQDEDIPDFVQEKFRDGFPEDWKDVANKWINILKKEKCGLSGLRVPAEKAELGSCVMQNDIRKKLAVAASQVSQQKEPVLQPLPKDNTREPLAKENESNQASKLSSRSSPLLRPAQNQQDESSDSEEEELDNKKANKEAALMPRYSSRLLSKSLLDTTTTNNKKASSIKQVNAKFSYLKNWTLEFSKRKGEVCLYGTLTDVKGNVLENCHYSGGIKNRVYADVVETGMGHLYRLVGPSSSRSKMFDFGFPVHWQRLKEQLSEQSRSARKDISAPMTRRSRSLSQVNTTHNKAHSSTVEDIKNGAPRKAKDDINVHKRMSSVPPTVEETKKRRKVSDEDKGQDKAQSDSVENTSLEDSTCKEKEIKRMENKDRTKVGERKTNAVEQSQPKTPEKIPAKPRNLTPAKMNVTEDKYALGLVTDDCHSDNDFNIF